MEPTDGPDTEALIDRASTVAQEWAPEKAVMAMRALAGDRVSGPRESLDTIAAEFGVSRETVRRARTELLHLVTGVDPRATVDRLPDDSPATARALRRLLTMTGPLAYDELLSAWERAGGKPPHSPLPSDLEALRRWAGQSGGFVFDAPTGTIAVRDLEPLDQVSQFLLDTLRSAAAGVDRSALLDAAPAAGLKPTTIATSLSHHPAVTRLGPSTWALRGHSGSTVEQAKLSAPRRPARVRPTTFSWAPDGSLRMEFSVPHGPSPVIAVPRAVSDLVEGREFAVMGEEKSGTLAVRNARLWGFGPLLSELGIGAGSRALIAINLISDTASLAAAVRKDGTP